MNTTYLFPSHDFGLEPLLKLLGIKRVNKVSSSDKER